MIGFGAYLGIQVLRFAKPPTIAVTDPATAVLDVGESATTYTLRGVTVPGAAVSVATSATDPYQVTAGSDGAWSADVELRRGRNQFDVSAVDRETRQAIRVHHPAVHHCAVRRERGADRIARSDGHAGARPRGPDVDRRNAR